MKTSTFREQQTVTIHSPRAGLGVCDGPREDRRVQPARRPGRAGQWHSHAELYFCGVHFFRKRKSSLLIGVGEDATIVARKIAERGARREHRPNDTK